MSESETQPTTLADRDRRILGHLAKHPDGLPVQNKMIELFGTYEAAGLVRLSGCRIGPLRLPDLDHFWAKMTPEGTALVIGSTPIRVSHSED